MHFTSSDSWLLASRGVSYWLLLFGRFNFDASWQEPSAGHKFLVLGETRFEIEASIHKQRQPSAGIDGDLAGQPNLIIHAFLFKQEMRPFMDSRQKQSPGVAGATMAQAESLLRPNIHCSKSPCSVLVGMPVLGPDR